MIITTAVRTSVERASGSGVSIALPSLAPTMRDPLARAVSSSMGPTGAGNAAGHERQQLGRSFDHDLRAWRRHGVGGVIPADLGSASRGSATGLFHPAGTPTGGRPVAPDAVDPAGREAADVDRITAPPPASAAGPQGQASRAEPLNSPLQRGECWANFPVHFHEHASRRAPHCGAGRNGHENRPSCH